MKTFQKIIVATDLTPASEPALKEAVEMAKEKGSELVITHVYQPPDVAQAEAITSGVYDEWDRNLRTAAEKGVSRDLDGPVPGDDSPGRLTGKLSRTGGGVGASSSGRKGIR